MPLDASAKVVGPRLLHTTQWGIIDPVDTPDGGNIGLHKNLAIGAHITTKSPPEQYLPLLRNIGLIQLEELTTYEIYNSTKLFLNGNWIGCVKNPEEIKNYLILLRRNSLIPIFTSIRWNIQEKELLILCDG